jgi:signal transduction histidine kinase
MANHTAGRLTTRLRNQATMIAIVAHDLRHPLYRITLATDLARGAEGDRATVARSLEAIRLGLASMNRLVEDLDDYASLQSGHLRLNCRPVHPAAVVSSAVGAFELFAASKQIELQARVSNSLPEIFADRDRLVQVISNLLTNALSLTPAGGTIEVAAEPDGDRARFTVSDSGPGIDPDELPHLFEHYWRGAHGTYAGRGLGLAIARALVESHGGEIRADNRPLCGARISFAIRAIGG